jgi:hypothetical protein
MTGEMLAWNWKIEEYLGNMMSITYSLILNTKMRG